MKFFIAIIDGTVVLKNVSFANSFFKRLIGLLFRKDLNKDDGLLIYPCNQIHTFGMKFCIDAVFLSPTFEVMHIEHNIPRGQISKYVKGASQVLELKGGIAEDKGILVGQTIIFTR